MIFTLTPFLAREAIFNTSPVGHPVVSESTRNSGILARRSLVSVRQDLIIIIFGLDMFFCKQHVTGVPT